MKLSSLDPIVCAALVVTLSGSALRAEAPNVEDLERRAITYRLENVKQGYVRMRVVNEKPPPSDTECLYEITFDPRRVRQVRRCRPQGRPEWGEPDSIVVTPDRYIADHVDAQSSTPVQVASAKDYRSPREHFRVLNVQALGMDANGADGLHTAHLESLLNRADRAATTVHADVRHGLETWRIDYDLKHRQRGWTAHVSLWIAPSQGFSVVGVEHRADQDGARYTTVVDSQMQQYPPGAVWYPSRVTKTVKEDDRVLDRQVITVEEARLGGAIDESAFTLAGLELKPGRPVVDSTSGQPWAKVWDGKEAVDPSQVQTAVPSKDRYRWLLWVLAAGLALLAFFYIRRAVGKRRSAPNPGA